MDNNAIPIIEVSPHQKSKVNTTFVMRQVIVGLIPAMIVSVFLFKLPAFLLFLVCGLTCILAETVVLKIRKKPLQIKDSSALLTGILLAMTLPPKTPLWCAFLGAVFAIVVGKHIFGGLGQNIFNPALVGRAFLMASFPVILTTWHNPLTLDAVTKATPLAMQTNVIDLKALFLGNVAGCLGETSAAALILGGLYIIFRGIADWRAPLGMFLGVSVLSAFLYGPNQILFHLFAGGIMLGLFFMITDPVTTPITKKGRFIFGLVVGLLVIVIRKFGGLPEGVMYSILFMNTFVPIIDKLTKPKPFGKIG